MEPSAHYATAHREGRWWVVEIPGVGATQGRTKWGVRFMARDLVAACLNIPRRDVRVNIAWVV